MRHRSCAAFAILPLLVIVMTAAGAGPLGYYRQPALHGDVVVFVAEGDLWSVSVTGGVARRLTSHPGEETSPAISPDGATIGFIGRYEGPAEVYSMPLAGGRPVRRTWGGGAAQVVGWSDADRLMYSTSVFSTLPSRQLAVLDVGREDVTAAPVVVPLAQAADGCYDDDGSTLFFTRLPFQGSHTRRYRGGTAQNIWRFAGGAPNAEATPLTADYPGTSKRPMWWRGRVYFASDRDDTMNLWSMRPDGGDLRQHTRHVGWSVLSPSLQGGRIVYQLGADLRIYDIDANDDRVMSIELSTDLDQTREHWIDEPMTWLTAAHLSHEGDRVVLTARGRVFVAPHRQGRLVEVTRRAGVRYREARLMPDGENVVALSDESGEVELWTMPANGVGDPAALTTDGEVLRWQCLPSPDGKWIAHWDKNQRLFVFDVERRENRLIDESERENFADVVWSPDSRWLAYVARAENMFQLVRLYDVEGRRLTDATTDRFDSYSPAWSPDGKWLYLLSDRNLASVVSSPWGNYQPEPFLDKRAGIYLLSLAGDERSPFAPADELHDESDDAEEEGDEETGDQEQDQTDEQERAEDEDESDDEEVVVVVNTDGLAGRLQRVPIPFGNYGDLRVNEGGLYWLSREAGATTSDLKGAPIARIDVEVETVLEGVRGYELSGDGKKMMIRKGDELSIIDAAPKKADLKKAKVDLSAWKLSIVPREEWRQMFVEAWRLERDYFYDRAMHGIDWPAMLERYLPLVDRVTTREELSDLTAQMVSELAALHIFVRSGETRSGTDDVRPSALGAVLQRDEAQGGYRVDRIYRSDPDDPERTSPLAKPGVDVREGDVIEMVNGAMTLSVPDIGVLLRHQAGRQVLLRVRSSGRAGETRDVIVEPITERSASDLRYDEWEYTRRLQVEEDGAGDIGYVHLRAMGGRNFTEWAREYYPVFNRKGLIVDVRHNRGGNIDSWIIGRLLRKAWFFWSQRVGHAPTWNMQYAFRGHIAVLCNERTASDGEAFTEGVKRLGLGRVFGMRTWGGEIWLSSSNRLVDRGIATAAEYGVYGPEGEWLIEGWGVEPDVVVDNLPHETFNGRDAQLEAVLAYLKQKIRDEPIPDLPPPAYPDKSAPDNR